MGRLAIVVCVIAVVAQTAQASPNHTSSMQVLNNRVTHANHVITFFSNHKFLFRKAQTKRIATRVLDKHVRIKAWSLKRIERISIPRTESELRAYINDDCLEDIIEWETAGTWSTTVYNYSGSGAYGLPQALPGHKMASHGADWATNPKTQIAWMRSYVNGRYGGSCNARAYKIAHGWY